MANILATLLVAAAVSASPADAVALALADAGTLPESDRPFQRVIWCPPWMPDTTPLAVSYAVNLAVSRSDVIQQPAVTGNAQTGVLVRWDLRRLARGQEAEFAELYSVWERLAESEPYFSVRSKVVIDKQTKTVAAPGGHTGVEQATILRGLTKSSVPIVRADWFLRMCLTTLEGGLYYEFAGIKKAPEGSKLTDQQFWLAKFGASEERSRELRSDQRVAMFRSLVTNKPRRTDWIKPQGGRDNDGRVFITHDIADGDILAAQHPMRNLLKFDDRARELIALKNNGMQEFALFNDAGALQREVPPDIARDSTIPPPHTDILQPGLSCIRCHGPNDGYMPLPNDVLEMLDKGVDVFGDLRGGGYTETLDLLAGLYTGRADKHLNRARDDYEEAVVRATNGRLGGEKISAITATSSLVSSIVGDYWYSYVTPQTALIELGESIDVPANEAGAAAAQRAAIVQDALAKLWPPLEPDPATGVSVRDPIMGGLLSGIAVRRQDWEAVYADAALQAINSKPQPAAVIQQQKEEIEVEP